MTLDQILRALSVLPEHTKQALHAKADSIQRSRSQSSEKAPKSIPIPQSPRDDRVRHYLRRGPDGRMGDYPTKYPDVTDWEKLEAAAYERRARSLV